MRCLHFRVPRLGFRASAIPNTGEGRRQPGKHAEQPRRLATQLAGGEILRVRWPPMVWGKYTTRPATSRLRVQPFKFQTNFKPSAQALLAWYDEAIVSQQLRIWLVLPIGDESLLARRNGLQCLQGETGGLRGEMGGQRRGGGVQGYIGLVLPIGDERLLARRDGLQCLQSETGGLRGEVGGQRRGGGVKACIILMPPTRGERFLPLSCSCQ